MIKIFSSSDYLLIHHYQNLLENAGIGCHIKQSYLSGGVGELPPIECWPELWIEDDLLQGKAMSLIQSSGKQGDGTFWQCQCGEQLEPQFNVCWKCGSERKERL
jgi:hypothetical protein